LCAELLTVTTREPGRFNSAGQQQTGQREVARDGWCRAAISKPSGPSSPAGSPSRPALFDEQIQPVVRPPKTRPANSRIDAREGEVERLQVHVRTRDSGTQPLLGVGTGGLGRGLVITTVAPACASSRAVTKPRAAVGPPVTTANPPLLRRDGPAGGSSRSSVVPCRASGSGTWVDVQWPSFERRVRSCAERGVRRTRHGWRQQFIFDGGRASSPPTWGKA